MCLIDEIATIIWNEEKGSLHLNNFYVYWRHEIDDVHSMIRFWLSFDPDMDVDNLPELFCHHYDTLIPYCIAMYLEDLAGERYLRGYIV